MANESIYAKRKYGFPQVKNSENKVSTTIEYIDVTATLIAAEPNIGSSWGEYVGTVVDTEIVEIENTGKSTLTVNLEYEAQSGGDDGLDPGTPTTTTYEIEWVMFQRSLFEHPRFVDLTSRDVTDIEKWKQEPNSNYKSIYRYEDITQDPPYVDLSMLAILFAKGIQKGQESYEDYSPVVRKTTTYVNGLPSESLAGQKDDPPSLPNLPVDYEWRKSADRAVQTESRNKWDRSEEWLGAIKILSDRDEIFWE